MNNSFRYGKGCHKMRDCPYMKSQYKGSVQAQSSGCSDAPKKNYFYALRSRGEKETSLDVVSGMLKVFYLDVYTLLYPGSTLSFVTCMSLF